MYLPSNSSSTAALVIAPKGENAIRICADYRPQNQWLYIPNETIPIPMLEIQKAAGFRLMCDWDMKNSFHQIPLDEESSKFLSVTIPWAEQVRPRFLPEGVTSAYSYQDLQGLFGLNGSHLR